MRRVTAGSKVEGCADTDRGMARWLSDLDARCRHSDDMILLSVPAPTRRARALLRLKSDLAFGSDRLLWVDPLGREAVAAIGATAQVSALGPDRFVEVERHAETLWGRLESIGDAVLPARLFGGFAFRPGHAQDSPWKRFGEARFILPRLCYQDSPTGASLTLALTRAEDTASSRPDSVRTLHDLAADLDRRPPDDREDPRLVPHALVSVHHDERQWVNRVLRARQDILSGHLEKVVIARSTELAFDAPVDVYDVLAGLARQDPGCTLFAFGWRDLLFLGATPERLIARNGLTIHTEALAGSANSADPSAADWLLNSRKDRAEHQLVVRELLSTLEPLCRTVSCGQSPEVRTLRHVAHLHTPLTGKLRQPVHILRLVEKLHPTPAVGGAPTDAALAWIDHHEPMKRGWYASPVGWFDARGDGRFDMALRSAVIEGHRAHLYAGAGIVAASDEQSELDETRLKLQTLFTALGVGS